MRTTTGVAIVATVWGCGSRVTLNDDGEPVPSPSPTSPDPDPDPSPAPAGLCGLPGDRPFMILGNGEELAVLYADGTRRVLDLGLDALPEDDRTVRSIAGGNHLATFASTVEAETGGLEANSVVSLFDAEGELLWRLPTPTYEASGVALSEDGTLLMHRYDYKSFGGDYVLVRDGALEPLPADVSPLHGWVVDGVVRANVSGEPAFYDLNSGLTTMVASAVGAIFSHPFDEGFLSLHEGKTVPWLYVDRYDDSQLLTLDGIDEPGSELIRVATTPNQSCSRATKRAAAGASRSGATTKARSSSSPSPRRWATPPRR